MENKLYKIVKAYPFSPPVGTILHYDSFADWYQNANEDYIIESRTIEKYPEHFEEVEDEYRFLVYTKDRAFHSPWKVVEFRKQPEDYNDKKDSEFIRFFKTKAEATEYILMNKPCLSYNDVSNMCILFKDVNWDHFKTTIDLDKLKEIIKKKV
jgi:hypothetical protein